MHLKVGIVRAMLRMRGLKPPDTHQEVWGISDWTSCARHEGKKNKAP